MSSLEPLLLNIWSPLFPGRVLTGGDHFFAMGGDSLLATRMILEVEKQAGLPVPVGQIFLTPVLRDFAAAIEGLPWDDSQPLYIPLKPASGEGSLFGIAPAMGGVFHFREFARALPDGLGLDVIEPRVSASGGHAYASLAELVRRCLEVMRSKQPQGPYRLIGYSFGGPVAWEMACLLEKARERVDVLVLLDASGRDGYPSRMKSESLKAFLQAEAAFLAEETHVHLEYGEDFDIFRMAPLLLKKLRERRGRPVALSLQSGAGTRSRAAAMNVPAQDALRQGYHPSPYHGQLDLFRASKQLTLHRELDYDLGWARYASCCPPRISRFEGDHFSLMQPPGVGRVASAVKGLYVDAERVRHELVERECREATGLAGIPFEEPVNGEAVLDRLAAVVAAFPNKVAIRDGGARLTFQELDQTARRIAAGLQARCPGERTPVLLHSHTSWQFVCAFYGILMAGRPCVPVDTDFPELRLQKIMTLSGATCGVSLDPALLARATVGRVPVFSLSELASAEEPPLMEFPVRSSPADPAAILFTSGSTGEPKGTVIRHEMFLHMMWRRSTCWELGPHDRYAVLYSSAFMGGLIAIHGPLMSGATICIYALRQRGLPALAAWMREERITVLHLITSILRRWLGLWGGQPPLPDLRLLIPGGEATRASDLDLWKRCCSDRVRFGACLGSTECGTLAANPIPPTYQHPGGPIPVGVPFASLGVRILREDGSEASAGEEGQILVESRFIFTGYLNQETAAVSNRADGVTVYRTGDYGYRDTAGMLYNLGRRDSRIKVNGVLVELAEIESVLMQSGLLEEVVVSYRPVGPESEPRQIVAFVQPSDHGPPQLESALGAWLYGRLPAAMMPARWVRLAVFPRTANGKTDRKALQALELALEGSGLGDLKESRGVQAGS